MNKLFHPRKTVCKIIKKNAFLETLCYLGWGMFYRRYAGALMMPCSDCCVVIAPPPPQSQCLLSASIAAACLVTFLTIALYVYTKQYSVQLVSNATERLVTHFSDVSRRNLTFL
jgi:hypothetical protein